MGVLIFKYKYKTYSTTLYDFIIIEFLHNNGFAVLFIIGNDLFIKKKKKNENNV